jgi:hypothetical protein
MGQSGDLSPCRPRTGHKGRNMQDPQKGQIVQLQTIMLQQRAEESV